MDDAALLEPGQCQVETWADRERGGARTLVHLGPACRVGPVELGLNLDRVRQTGEGAVVVAGPQLKWAVPLTASLSAGVALAAAWQDGSGPRFVGSTVVVPITWQAADTLAVHAPHIPLVVDPVMVAKGGARLIDEDAIVALKERLLPLARLITPNLPEAQALTGVDPSAEDGLKAALAAFARMGCRDILFKGGHAEGPVVEDVLGNAQTGALLRLSAPRQDTRHTHGTGCTLATAIACGLAENLSLVEAVGRAHRYVQRAIAAAPGLGQGHGPLGHKV